MTNETNYDTLFGKMAIEQGLCTDEELKHSLKQMEVRRKIDPVILQDLMIELGFITVNQATRLNSSIKESKAAAHQIPGYKILGKLGAAQWL
jgi:hypothetical protein